MRDWHFICLCVLSFVLKMSTPKRKRNLLDFHRKEIVKIKNPKNNMILGKQLDIDILANDVRQGPRLSEH
jgi:hypothetical protein